MVRLQLRVLLISAPLAGCMLCVAPESGERELRAQRELHLLVDAERSFLKATGRAPQSIVEMAPPGCVAGGCVLGGLPRDPWGNAYQSKRVGEHLRFFSLGADGIWATGDDLSVGWREVDGEGVSPTQSPGASRR